MYLWRIQSPRAPELSWKKRKPSKTKLELWHSIGIWRMHIHFARFVLWRDNDRPDFTREFNRDAFHAATSPGCTREFTRDDSRVTFPKSLAAFYPAFHPRDLSHCDITRVHPGEICSAWKGYYMPWCWTHPGIIDIHNPMTDALGKLWITRVPGGLSLTWARRWIHI